MKIAIASDHGGINLKRHIIAYLQEQKYHYHDFGTFSDESVDYPDFAQLVAEAVVKGDYDVGIICCGTGIGVSIAANKVPGIRAALCHDTFSARMSREHNDANVLTLGERVVGPGLALDIVAAFLGAQHAGGRHARRVAKIKAVEQKYSNQVNG
ncbi:MAG: ribose 5-phosphate isomerase B [Firmicutes bacterium]|nr:ribose 5-phosphate isomerase B [Bacillota bacterium]